MSSLWSSDPGYLKVCDPVHNHLHSEAGCQGGERDKCEGGGDERGREGGIEKCNYDRGIKYSREQSTEGITQQLISH